MKWIILAASAASPALAADHAEAPMAAEDTVADLADLYTWYEDGNLVVALTFGWMPAGYTDYDREVLYRVHLDTDGDLLADHTIDTRFGTDAEGAWGVQVSGIPGEVDPVVGPVETPLTTERESRVWVGGRDDPFFFDLQGFSDTLATGTLMFDSTRDSLAGSNVAAIVLSFDASTVTDADGSVRVWATTSRL